MIDVKTLRIGSHVEYKGKIVRICSLKTNMANYDEGKGKPRCYSCMKAYYKYLQPIPITPEMLEKIGFYDCRTGSTFSNMGLAFSELRNGEWLVEFDVIYQRLKASCIVRYLHEAEAFLALHGVELIKE